jgi:hypothetical protein
VVILTMADGGTLLGTGIALAVAMFPVAAFG